MLTLGLWKVQNGWIMCCVWT